MHHETIVIGLGGMGSAACYLLAKRGVKVLGLDRFSPGHALGSSHGETRLIRKAYFEDERYVPLVKRAYTLWEDLEARAGRVLLHKTGLLLLSSESTADKAVGRAIASGAKHGIPLDILSAEEAGRRFPQLVPPPGYRGVFEPGAGYLDVEACVTEHCRLAEAAGATLRAGEAVESWSASTDGVTVRTTAATYHAAKLVIAAGAWAGALLKDLHLPLTVLRIPQLWFPASEAYEEARGMPCFAFDTPETFVYGFPRRMRSGLKAAEYHPPRSEVQDPLAVDRTLTAEDGRRVREWLGKVAPGVTPRETAGSVCLYTMTPDTHFIVDKHPRHANVVFAAGFSGHGFKFAPAIGECLASLALHGTAGEDAAFLSLDRFPSI